MLLAFALAAICVLGIAIVRPFADKAVQEISLPLRHEDIIRQQADDKGLDPSLIAGVIYVESRFRDQTSIAGAKGLMQILPSTADYIARKSGGTAFEQGDLATRRSTSPTAPGTCATCWSTTTATSCWRSPPTTRARARSTSGTATRPRAARTSRQRRTSRSPRPATTWARCSRCARATATNIDGSWVCDDERAAAGPDRPERVRDRLRRLGHRRRHVAGRAGRRVRAGAAPRDRPRPELHRHRAGLRPRALGEARRPGRARARGADRRLEQDPAEEPRVAGPGRDRPRRGVPRRPHPQVHRAHALQPRHGRPGHPAVPRLERRVGRSRELAGGDRGAQGRGQDPLLRHLDQRPPARERDQADRDRRRGHRAGDLQRLRPVARGRPAGRLRAQRRRRDRPRPVRRGRARRAGSARARSSPRATSATTTSAATGTSRSSRTSRRSSTTSGSSATTCRRRRCATSSAAPRSPP